MQKICFLDIDGTLLPEGKQEIPESSLEALKRAQANGHLIYICTGRGIGSARRYLEMAGADGHITSNGQEASFDGEVIHQHYFENQDIDDVLTLIQKYTPYWSYERQDGIEIVESNGAQQLLDQIRGYGLIDSQIVSEVNKNGMFQIWAFGGAEEISTIEKELDSKFGCYRWSDSSLEIAPIKAGKGLGIQKVIEHFQKNNVEVETFGFGDGTNDFTMMETVDHPVAMGNAIPALQAKCEYVTTDVEEDGIYNAFKHYGLI
ncbi:MAG: Cof-type HAD-IIB family hydrolase [Mycoplasmatales bacterium]